MQPIDLLYRAAALAPDAPAVEHPGGRLTYAELVGRVDALAAGLQALDPAVQSRVGVCAHNTLEHLIALLATLAADKAWVPLNPLDAAPELEAKIETARPSIVVADADCLSLLPAGDARLVVGAGAGTDAPDSVADLLRRHAGERPRHAGLDGALTQAVKFTGGSSGRPKGVCQPYRAWLAGAAGMLHAMRFDARDRYLVAAPLTHGTSCYVTPVLAAGGTLVILGGRARPGRVLDAIESLEITSTFLPPTLIYMLMSELGERTARAPRLRLLIYGGASMPPERIRDARAAFGDVIAANYGLTEAPQIITCLLPHEAASEATAGSAGRPGLLTRVAIVDAQDRFLAPGEVGEIVVRGDLVMTGYLDMPQQTAEAIRAGWLHTGDVGSLDERGYLFIRDRLKDVIISGGFNVYPSDVEAALVAHPAVHECVVFGLADEKWGEAVNVAVQLRPGAQASEAELIAFAKARVGSVKAPKRVRFVADLPRSAVGKVQRRAVRARFEEGETA